MLRKADDNNKTKASTAKQFMDLLATDGGAILTLIILLHTHIIVMLFGFTGFGEAYLLILGALLGVIRGEYRKKSRTEGDGD